MKAYGNTNSQIVLLQPVDEHDLDIMEQEIEIIQKETTVDFQLIAYPIKNWNHELSPWEAPAVFGKEGFGAGANKTLQEILKPCVDNTKTYILGGYSLAGLFALWAAYQTDAFTAIAAASPSVWFPGYIDYMKNHKFLSKAAYLSLGDREEKTKNPTMSQVGNCIREAHAILTEKEVKSILEWNPGNHFKDAELRTAKAFAWAIQAINEL